jgi:hypothetical protein
MELYLVSYIVSHQSGPPYIVVVKPADRRLISYSYVQAVPRAPRWLAKPHVWHVR